jgi:glycerophosphoryl diester phosphodiesterase
VPGSLPGTGRSSSPPEPGCLPLVCAHRGARELHPDSTPEAFEAAIEAGADMLETDVRRAADGRLVLAHDPLPGGRAGGAMPLPALLRQAAGRTALDLELKEAGWEHELLAAVDPRPPGMIATSFLPEAVAALRRLAPGLPAGLLLAPEERADPLQLAAACGSTLVAPHVTLTSDALLARALQAGLPVVVWTVNEEAELTRLCRHPAVAVVITDRPARALEIRAAGR